MFKPTGKNAVFEQGGQAPKGNEGAERQGGKQKMPQRVGKNEVFDQGGQAPKGDERENVSKVDHGGDSHTSITEEKAWDNFMTSHGSLLHSVHTERDGNDNFVTCEISMMRGKRTSKKKTASR